MRYVIGDELKNLFWVLIVVQMWTNFKWFQHFHIFQSTSFFVFSLLHMDISSKEWFSVVCPKQTTSSCAVDRWRNISTSPRDDEAWNVSITIAVLPSSSAKKRKSVNWLERLIWTKWFTPLVIFTTFLKVRFKKKHLVRIISSVFILQKYDPILTN